MTIEQIIAGELSVRPQQAAATLELLDSGNTIPFIARYRKEVTGSLDEEQIRMISERAQYLRNLEERRQEILESITSQEKLTHELENQIKAAVKMQELEDLYLPYRPKKRTRAQIARERGLEPLAELIMAQSQPLMTLDKLASLHVDPEKGVNSVSEAWAGASDIVAENISDRADIRELDEVRKILEAAIVERAAARRTPQDMERIESLLAQRGAAAEAGDLERCIAADIAFHAAIAEATHNEILSELYRTTTGHLQKGFRHIYRDTACFRASQPTHARLARNIADTDVQQALDTIAVILDEP